MSKHLILSFFLLQAFLSAGFYFKIMFKNVEGGKLDLTNLNTRTTKGRSSDPVRIFACILCLHGVLKEFPVCTAFK